jgi:hypothetical protein
MNVLASPTIPAFDDVDHLEQMLAVDIDDALDDYPYTRRDTHGDVAMSGGPLPP